MVGENGAYPSELYIEWSKDGLDFTRIPKKLYIKKPPTKAITLEFEPVEALAVRIAIEKFVIWPAVRFEFLYTD